MFSLKNYNYIYNHIKTLSKTTTLIAVTKSQELSKINLLIEKNHFHFGENRVQEASIKWKDLLLKNPKLQLHFIGKLQSNKANDAFEIFSYIHSLENEKLAQIFARFESNSSKKIKYFIQVNIGDEPQKNGIHTNKLNQFILHCINDLKLNVIGLMCIPPIVGDPDHYFKKLAKLAIENNLSELSMGMSNDYECAIRNGATFVRIGSKIFNEN